MTPILSPALSITGLRKRFDGTHVVDDVDLDVYPGELLALLGPSGCGKTTTLRLIAGFETPDGGRIVITGEPVAGQGRFIPPERRRVGMVFQEYALFPHLSVEANVGFGLGRGNDRTQRVPEMLRLVGLGDVADRLPGELSGGQQQRVAVARALAPAPDVLLLDEPFSNLDQALRVRLRGEIRDILRAANVTTILVTHDQDEALGIADRVAVMLDGRIRQVDTPETIYRAPSDRRVAAFVGDMQLIPGDAAGDRVDTCLGSLLLRSPAHGTVEVLVRPEMLRIDASAVPHGQRLTVKERRFAGPVCTVVLAMADGTALRATCSSAVDMAVGDAVSVSVLGPVVCYGPD
ncbi:MAG TPA: ABC transporter ATP-binding protein [Thermomicrobiales bacterium]|nr:ABC transporter ATP-binding protein [Thermomicrobiales bacterium]